jgi:hypothetical protein
MDMEIYTPGNPNSLKIELTATEVADILNDLSTADCMWQATWDLQQALEVARARSGLIK